jgi:hypothetical protein
MKEISRTLETMGGTGETVFGFDGLPNGTTETGRLEIRLLG